MTDEVKRGFSPKDEIEFGAKWKQLMNDAAAEVRYLIDRGYDVENAVTFVGNHYLLSKRQRTALTRILATNDQLQGRYDKEIKGPLLGGVVNVDGFNTIITLEVALSGSLLLQSDDGTIKDLAGLHGTYRIVDKTFDAVYLLLEKLARTSIDAAEIYLDRPVSNSGRLRELIEEQAKKEHLQVNVYLEDHVDKLLSGRERVITSDGIILDSCRSWCNINKEIIAESIPDAWIYRIGGAHHE